MIGRLRYRLAKIICPADHRITPYIPLRRQLRAAGKSMSPGAREGKPWVSASEKHEIRYQAMLDALESTESESRHG